MEGASCCVYCSGTAETPGMAKGEWSFIAIFAISNFVFCVNWRPLSNQLASLTFSVKDWNSL